MRRADIIQARPKRSFEVPMSIFFGLLTIVVLFAVISHASPGANVEVLLSPAGSFVGKTASVSGFATLQGDTVSANDIRVNLKDLKTGIDLRDEHTQRHLNADKFPEAVLVSGTGKDGKGQGLIRINGVEKQVAGTYVVQNDELDADFPLKLSDFNITGIKYMGIGVKDEVHLHVVVPVKK